VETSEHPPYSPDLAPSDFHLFGPLKNYLGGKRFPDDKEVETELWKRLRQESIDFFGVGFIAQVKQWDKCVSIDGGYVKK
jgi:histone-lysine N-methyltransferase SETMAR